MLLLSRGNNIIYCYYWGNSGKFFSTVETIAIFVILFSWENNAIYGYYWGNSRDFFSCGETIAIFWTFCHPWCLVPLKFFWGGEFISWVSLCCCLQNFSVVFQIAYIWNVPLLFCFGCLGTTMLFTVTTGETLAFFLPLGKLSQFFHPWCSYPFKL